MAGIIEFYAGCILQNLFEADWHVAVNHENNTCFENGLVMSYADCKYFAGLVETSKNAAENKNAILVLAFQTPQHFMHFG